MDMYDCFDSRYFSFFTLVIVEILIKSGLQFPPFSIMRFQVFLRVAEGRYLRLLFLYCQKCTAIRGDDFLSCLHIFLDVCRGLSLIALSINYHRN